MINTILLLIILGIVLLDLVAIFIVMTDDFLYWYEKFFKVLIILLLPIIGALLEFKRNDDGTGFGPSSNGGGAETPLSFGSGD